MKELASYPITLADNPFNEKRSTFTNQDWWYIPTPNLVLPKRFIAALILDRTARIVGKKSKREYLYY